MITPKCRYGRQLLNANQNREALEVFEQNAKRLGEAWPTHVGLARGYAATGDKAQALEHAKKALVRHRMPSSRRSASNLVKLGAISFCHGFLNLLG